LLRKGNALPRDAPPSAESAEVDGVNKSLKERRKRL